MDTNIKRLEYLSSFALQFDQHKEDLQPIVELARYITQSPICQINLLDSHNQLTIVGDKGGSDEDGIIPREQSVCRNTVIADDIREIQDLREDDRYNDNYYVQNEPWYRYYCGVQLTTSDDINIGTVCVLDTKPRQLSEGQITQLKNLADLAIERLEERMQLKKLVSDIDHLKDEFHKLNHDLKSPVNGIIGVAEMLMEDAEDKEILENLDIVKQCATAIIDDVEGVVKLVDEQDKPEFRDKKTNLVKVFEKISQLYKPLAQRKNILLHIPDNIARDISIPRHYAVKLIQMIGNLVDNALKFSPEESEVKVECELRESEDSNTLCINIKDNGMGMSEEQIRAFNQNEKVARSHSDQEKATYGMGLENVRELIAQQGGTAEAESANGTHFSITLPV